MYILKLLFVFLVTFVLFFYIGHIARQIIGYRKSIYSTFNDLFVSIIIGLSATVITFAMIKSHGTSIYSIILLLSLIYLKIKNKKFTFQLDFKLKINFKIAIYTIIALFISFIYWLFFTFNLEGNDTVLAFADYHFYSDTARGLIKTGIENRHNRMFDFYLPTDGFLYHYFDSWVVALISTVSRINTFDIQMIIVYPFFFFLTILGTATVLELKKTEPLFIIILSILVLFSYQVCFLKNFNISFLSFWGFALSPGSYLGMKLLCIYPFVLFSIRFLFQNRTLEFLILLLFTSLVYNTLFIWILLGLFFVAIILMYLEKKQTGFYFTPTVKQHAVILTVFVISLALYKILFVSNSTSSNETGIFYLTNIKSIIIIFCEHIIKFSIGYIPTILLFLFTVRRIKFRETKVLIFFSFFIGGFLATTFFITLFNGSPNFNQALSNFTPHFALSLFLLCCFFVPETWLKPILIALIPLSIINTYSIFQGEKTNKVYSKNYLSEVLSTLKPHEKFLICNPQNDHWFCYDVAEFTSKLTDNCSGFNISLETNDTYNSQSPFILWCNLHNKKINYNSLTEYLLTENVRYIFSIDQKSFPKELSKTYRLISEDKYTNECFYKIVE